MGQANQVPTARASANVTAGTAPLTVQFTGNTSSDPDAGDSLSYFWDFGDGNTSNSIDPSHQFTSEGIYDVVLTVTDNGNPVRSSTATTITINVGQANQAPTARASANVTAGTAPLTVQFTSNTSSDPDPGDTLSYFWDFGDGNTSNSIDPSHQFTSEGTYDVILTVTDNGNPAQSTTATTITINVEQANQTPTARSSADVTTGTAPLTVKFTGNTSSDPDPGDTLSYFWDFGDGSTSTSANPTHKFSAAGTYEVVLTVTDDGSPIRSNSPTPITITVEETPNTAPIAVDDNFTVAESGDLNVLILTNDTDSEGDDLTVNWVGGSPANIGQSISGSGGGGLFTITAGGNLTFNTNGEFDGLNNGDSQTTTVQYRVTDGNSNSNIATVTVTVTGVDDPKSSENDITQFTLSPTSGNAILDDVNHTATITVPFGTDLLVAPTNLVVSTGASVSPLG
ncbi:PKD domain-containing protein, partial [Zobellia sp. 1_MG-2023]|uniref:PKD domain-containing protein n=1 Tax=Zobellia sp. 1_MG-2023 TaxID=3062626 RepID=UPI0026E23AED